MSAKTEYVILTTIDGVRPDGLAKANTPIIDKMMKNGAATINGRTVFPSITLPVHTSLFYGKPPQLHGVMDNNTPLLCPVDKYTTLFDHLKRAGKSNMVFSTWQEFRNTYGNIGSIDLLHMEVMYDNYAVLPTDKKLEDDFDTTYFEYAKNFAENFVKRKVNLAYVYLEMPDVYGHNYNWMSPEYIDAISRSDQALRVIYDIVENSELAGKVTYITTTDHGGHDNTHGSDRAEDMTIFWSAYGAGIKSGVGIENLNIIDTTPTVSGLLGVKPHGSWNGRELVEVYE